jgi:hypothetical protein
MNDPNLSRRGFLGWAATGAAGLLLPSVVKPRAKVFDMGRGLAKAPPMVGNLLFLAVHGYTDQLEIASDDGRQWLREAVVGHLGNGFTSLFRAAGVATPSPSPVTVKSDHPGPMAIHLSSLRVRPDGVPVVVGCSTHFMGPLPSDGPFDRVAPGRERTITVLPPSDR